MKFSTATSASDTIQALQACQQALLRAQQPQSVVDNFSRLFGEVASGSAGVIAEESIEPVKLLPKHADLSRFLDVGLRALDQLVVCKLNGGLGTTMGLERAKSLLTVKKGLSFNDVVVAQLRAFTQRQGVHVSLLNMTSFATHRDIEVVMQQHPELYAGLGVSCFQQHQHPKILLGSLMPAQHHDESLVWNPPGHGDIYTALMTSGLLGRLIAAGKRYLFVSNVDNLGATVDPAILGYLVDQKVSFLMEVTERTEADKKGGHLARCRTSGALLLRESGQAPKDARGEVAREFQDIARHRFFNTNNLWIDLAALAALLQRSGGYLPLPLIRAEKTLDPRDASSPKVYHLETAMGAAIGLFEGAQALEVDRTRFAPVKANSDLLAVRSDAYTFDQWQTLVPSPKRLQRVPPLVSLDATYYKLIDAFEARFKVIPSLVRADSFKVLGNVSFAAPLAVVGKGSVVDQRSDRSSPVPIPAEITVLDNQDLVISDQGATLIRPQ